MSVAKQKDGWDRNAAQLLRRRIAEGSPDRAINYAPDCKYGAGPGPLTVQIDQILRRHADLWAHTMRTADPNEQLSAVYGRTTWFEQMRQADAEILRLVGGHTITRGAA